jgi:hypothetical protein
MARVKAAALIRLTNGFGLVQKPHFTKLALPGIPAGLTAFPMNRPGWREKT